MIQEPSYSQKFLFIKILCHFLKIGGLLDHPRRGCCVGSEFLGLRMWRVEVRVGEGVGMKFQRRKREVRGHSVCKRWEVEVSVIMGKVERGCSVIGLLKLG